ncbi:transposase [Noviherbaspirillum sp.]|uniref:transposase n=1 Tax=Noviherbaspirillum sp. TaxID=1926288 RepID=UPI002FE0C5D5
MARLPRLVIPHQPHHVIQRGNDRQIIFHAPEDYEVFLRWMREAARQFHVLIHAYVLMPNHLHLLATPADDTGLARMMQWIGRYYVPYFNRKYLRSGTLWEGRYKATVIDSERYFMVCSCYIELNPVRASLVTMPDEYPWSSYMHHIGAKVDPIITDHALYWSLGNTPFEREAAYKSLVEQGITIGETQALTEATQKGWALGSPKFKLQLEKTASRRVGPMKRGRPKKALQTANASKDDSVPI